MQCQTLILGAGAAGMMAAACAGPDVVVVDHARAPGEKIRISGGGRCNFTNIHCTPDRFLGRNPHFHKSALARYSPWDFIALMDRHGIAWHEKTLGQLFCDGKATAVVAMLRDEMAAAGARLWLQTAITALRHADGRFVATLEREGRRVTLSARNLVLATGGKSIPKMGATGLAYDLARQFGHAVTDTRPALVPLTFEKGRFAELAGVSTAAGVSAGGMRFDEALLFTHRGLSGPAVLQASSYWREGAAISLDLAPDGGLGAELRAARRTEGKRLVTTALGTRLPARLVRFLGERMDLGGTLAECSDARIDAVATALRNWPLRPAGTEGYRTAEVTLGGVETDGLASGTLMSRHLPGLFVIGEAVDVTGWLGGYNFQWAWASAVAAGEAIAERARAT